jgi:hypothetical protein
MTGNVSAQATESGWRLSGLTAIGPTADPLGAYVGQLVQEDIARPIEGGWELPWDSVYAVLADPEHAGSVGC